MTPSGRCRAALAAGGALVALAYALAATPWPDDWDGVGFVLSMRRFDLDQFAPHPPGYPVYVALLRASAAAFGPTVAAADAVAVASGAATALLVASAALRRFGARAAAAVLVAIAVTPLAARAATGVGSEAPALALAALVVYGLARLARPEDRLGAALVGVGVGLGLGVRLSWAPLFLAAFAAIPAGARRRAAAWAAAATLAWAIPLAAIVGPAHLVALLRVHAHGHFHTWGGTGGSLGARAALFARGIFVDGLGVDATALGVAIALAGAALLIVSARRSTAVARARVGRAALLFAPYAAWVYLGQNVAEQPRHLLPLVAALAVGLGIAATTSRAASMVGAALAVLVAARAGADAFARRTVPPGGEAFVADVDALAARAAGDVVGFGGRSARFFALSPTPDRGRTVASLGDVRLAIGRMPRPPARVLVTDELAGLDRTSLPLVPHATHCRPERLDRRRPCLVVYEVDGGARGWR